METKVTFDFSMRSGPLRIVLMRGGPSAEREVSLKTGAAIGKALRALGHHVTEVDPRPNDLQVPAATDLVFLALHGTFGEDGTLQATLEKMGLPYTGCGPEASRLAFDKALTKQRCVERGIPTARSLVMVDAHAAWPTGWQPPVVLKPVRQGSSVGLAFIDEVDQWPAALTEVLKHDTEALLEERILGRETTVGILDGKPLPVVEVRPKSGGYDFQNKYTAGRTDYFCPASFSPEVTEKIQQAAWQTFQALGGRDYSRIDVMVRENGEPVVLEMNTLPGMTETSLLPKAAAAAGLEFNQLCQVMVNLAWDRASRKEAHVV